MKDAERIERALEPLAALADEWRREQRRRRNRKLACKMAKPIKALNEQIAGMA